MNAKTKPKDDYLAKLEAHFIHNIAKEDFAISIRRFLYTSLMTFLNNDQMDSHKDWFEDGYFQLTQLLEALDPELKRDKSK